MSPLLAFGIGVVVGAAAALVALVLYVTDWGRNGLWNP